MITKIRERVSSAFQMSLECYILFEKDLGGYDTEILKNAHIICNAGDPRAERLAQFYREEGRIPNYLEPLNHLNQRLKRGFTAFLFEKDGEAQGYCWAYTGSKIHQPRFSRKFRMDGKTALFTDAYVSPTHRGKGIHKLLNDARANHFYELGFTRSNTYVGANNIASIINSIKFNDRYRIIYHVGLDIPFFNPMNFFPKWEDGNWSQCKP